MFMTVARAENKEKNMTVKFWEKIRKLHTTSQEKN